MFVCYIWYCTVILLVLLWDRACLIRLQATAESEVRRELDRHLMGFQSFSRPLRAGSTAVAVTEEAVLAVVTTTGGTTGTGTVEMVGEVGTAGASPAGVAEAAEEAMVVEEPHRVVTWITWLFRGRISETWSLSRRISTSKTGL